MSELTRTKVKDLLKAAPGIEVLAKGWVRTKRGNKQIKFIALNDGSTVHNIQVVADMANFDESLIAKVTTGASLAVKGVLVESVGSQLRLSIVAPGDKKRRRCKKLVQINRAVAKFEKRITRGRARESGQGAARPTGLQEGSLE